MKNRKHFLVSLAIAFGAICMLVSCDPAFYVEIYLKNQTSQTIVFQATCRGYVDSTGYVNQNDISITINSGERVLLFDDCGLGYFERDAVSNYMKNNYPDGIRIVFENGDTINYNPLFADSVFHSPYNSKSYFFRTRKEDNEATYTVLY